MLIVGKNSVKEYLNSGSKVYQVYLMNNFNDKELLELLNNYKIKYFNKYELDKMTSSNHQGIIIEGEDYEYCDLDELIKDNSILVMLDHLSDPHNLGAIIRTGEAAHIDGIIIPKDRSVLVNDTVMKVSSGAANYVKIALVTNLANTIKKLKDNNFWIVGLDMNGTNYKEIDYKGKICIIVGSEGFGLSRLVKESCDFIASIPMNGKINSLNASVAAGIIIYEAISQRK